MNKKHLIISCIWTENNKMFKLILSFYYFLRRRESPALRFLEPFAPALPAGFALEVGLDDDLAACFDAGFAVALVEAGFPDADLAVVV